MADEFIDQPLVYAFTGQRRNKGMTKRMPPAQVLPFTLGERPFQVVVCFALRQWSQRRSRPRCEHCQSLRNRLGTRFLVLVTGRGTSLVAAVNNLLLAKEH